MVSEVAPIASVTTSACPSVGPGLWAAGGRLERLRHQPAPRRGRRRQGRRNRPPRGRPDRAAGHARDAINVPARRAWRARAARTDWVADHPLIRTTR